MLAKPAPRPSEFASQARPRPAARPPSMAPQGRLGAAAAGAGVAGLGAALVAFCCAGAVGDADSRCVTLDDWRPNDLPPPMRAASACTLTRASTQARNKELKLFMSSPLSSEVFASSTLDSNMKGDHATRHVVIVHMPETALFHEGLELVLRGVHPDGFGQVAIAR